MGNKKGKRFLVNTAILAISALMVVLSGVVIYIAFDLLASMVSSKGSRFFENHTAFDRLIGTDKAHASEQQWLRLHTPDVIPCDDFQAGTTCKVHPEARLEPEGNSFFGSNAIVYKNGQSFVHVEITQSPDTSDNNTAEHQIACVSCYTYLPISKSDMTLFTHHGISRELLPWFMCLVFFACTWAVGRLFMLRIRQIDSTSSGVTN
jgi:hypothetical protein